MRNPPKIVAGTEIDKKVTVLVWRNGKMVEIKISVGELEEEQIAKKEVVKPITPVKEKQLKIESLGLRLGDFSPQIGKRFKLKDIDKGVVVVGVETGSPAFEQGIRDGDIIIELGQVGVNTIAEVKTQLKDIKSRGRKTVLLLIKNISGLRFVALKFIGE
jgi:serine protease Do